jgi:hypothetical protein
MLPKRKILKREPTQGTLPEGPLVARASVLLTRRMREIKRNILENGCGGATGSLGYNLDPSNFLLPRSLQGANGPASFTLANSRTSNY